MAKDIKDVVDAALNLLIIRGVITKEEIKSTMNEEDDDLRDMYDLLKAKINESKNEQKN